MSKFCVVIPTYNEIDNIESIVTRVRTAVPAATVLVVDDNSPDGTGERASQLAERDDNIFILNRAEKQGLGEAYRAGFRWALDNGVDFVAEIDADGSHDPAELPIMFDIAQRTHSDVVLGARWIAGGRVMGWSAIRQLISRCGNIYAQRVLSSSSHDLTAGFRILSRRALKEIDRVHTTSNGYCFQVEVVHKLERAGFPITEHPITFVEREHGVSKMHAGIVWEALYRITVWGIEQRRQKRQGRSGQ